MHLNRLGETDRLACQPLDPGSQCEMLALNLLCVSFAHLVLIGIDMTHVLAPIVRIIARDAKGLRQRFELQEDLLLTTTKHIRQDFATAVINRMPSQRGSFLRPT